MKIENTRLIAILIALAAIAALAADASAYYHPTIGRFVNRDPGPGRGATSPTATAHFPQRDPAPGGSPGPATAAPAPTANFLPRDPTGSNQYADGMNLYQYVGSNPIVRVDPRGTDFIAISNRSVLGLYHYVIMYWRCK